MCLLSFLVYPLPFLPFSNLPPFQFNLRLPRDLLVNKRMFFPPFSYHYHHQQQHQSLFLSLHAATATSSYTIVLNAGDYAATPASSNTIVLNAAGTALSPATSGFFVDPVRSFAGSANLAYNATTKEIYVASSSRRYKTDIQDVTTSESAHVWDLRPVSYRAIEEAYNANAPVYYGFIAEEVAEVDPRLCFWSQDADGMTQVEGVNYDQVIPLLLQEAKHLNGKIAALEAGLEADNAKIAALEAGRAALEAGRDQDASRIAELEKKMEALLLKFQ